ncbi:hypothetical protein AAHA92_10044 [Salvia divinorum]|uniref:Uncharacterized protein n=1 Tax=Salvia divinorum TaxID=28513 RepID=A0ABD1HTC2_SALDI
MRRILPDTAQVSPPSHSLLPSDSPSSYGLVQTELGPSSSLPYSLFLHPYLSLHRPPSQHQPPTQLQPAAIHITPLPLHSPAPDAAAVSPSDQVVLQVLLLRFHPWSADTKRRSGCSSYVVRLERKQ